MITLRERIRPTDLVLAALLSAVGVLLMVVDMQGQSGDTRIDSTSWTLIPVFLLATLPVAFRRVNLLAVIVVSAAALAVHDVAFDWVVRCGAGLPLAGALAYSAGRLLADRRTSLVALALTIGVQALVLVRDSAAGIGILPVTAAIGIALWGTGWFVRTRWGTRSDAAAPAPSRVPEAV
ncbi:hypothetical protein [Jatrophihabitans endophyticus]|uniref:hypothetical protein n=1 Tax=Jatrophihabitans endophyticus TaxID=1206085 RepID=UPI0019D84C55|nr:hypothetical protein [Jatrophihabitans endophyticus]MBE7189421.1 hypothetical protein [Jatrophihabitans endophyticus]